MQLLNSFSHWFGLKLIYFPYLSLYFFLRRQRLSFWNHQTRLCRCDWSDWEEDIPNVESVCHHWITHISRVLSAHRALCLPSLKHIILNECPKSFLVSLSCRKPVYAWNELATQTSGGAEGIFSLMTLCQRHEVGYHLTASWSDI